MTKQSVKETLRLTKRKGIYFSITVLLIGVTVFSLSLKCEPIPSPFSFFLVISYLFSAAPAFLLAYPFVGSIENTPYYFSVPYLIAYYYILFSVFYSALTNKQNSVNNKGRAIRAILIFIFIILLATVVLVSFPGATGKSNTSRIISAIAQARTVMMHINFTNDNFDDFTCQHSDMIDLCKDINKSNGKAMTVHDSFNNSEAACIYSPINIRRLTGFNQCIKEWFYNGEKFSKSNAWYCADSQGYAGRTTTDPGSAGYCVDGVSAKCPPTFD